MKEPYVLVGEDIGALEFEYQLLLYRLGDQRFSQMLAREQPMVRAAVRKFIPFARMPGKFSPTEKLLEGTRKIDFPVGKKEIKQVWKILGGGDGTKVALICRVRAELSGDSTQAAVRSIATLDNLAVNR